MMFEDIWVFSSLSNCVALTVLSLILTSTSYALHKWLHPPLENGTHEGARRAGHVAQTLPLSVNYHFTRQCNYSCGFCFHTAKTSDVLPIEDAKRGIQMLKDAETTSTPNGTHVEARREGHVAQTLPLSVNYHFTRQCNYSCGFCFHTAKTSHVLPIEDAKQGIQMLKDAGMQKINFSGGEPFIVQKGKFVGELVRFCKVDLQLPSVTIVSNGSLIAEKWFKRYGEYLDILAISCDSFDPEVNKLIGRQQGKKNHLDSLRLVRDMCTKYKVAFKINSVINTHNIDEDMADYITDLDPVRWKVFQCLLIGGENSGEDALRHAESYVISPEEFQAFLDRHKDVKCLVPESNEKMQNSYLILDEYMRFLDCTRGSKDPSKSILDVGVTEALKFSGFDGQMFLKRGGKYTWSKADMKLEW